jgi:hypothetical protein
MLRFLSWCEWQCRSNPMKWDEVDRAGIVSKRVSWWWDKRMLLLLLGNDDHKTRWARRKRVWAILKWWSTNAPAGGPVHRIQKGYNNHESTKAERLERHYTKTNLHARRKLKNPHKEKIPTAKVGRTAGWREFNKPFGVGMSRAGSSRRLSFCFRISQCQLSIISQLAN